MNYYLHMAVLLSVCRTNTMGISKLFFLNIPSLKTLRFI